MQYLTELTVAMLGAIMLGVIGWGVSLIKDYLNLDPDGKLYKSIQTYLNRGVEWIMDYSRDKGEDLEIPETRWALVNKALDWLIPEIPKLMDFFGYDKEKIAIEIEQLVKKKLREVSS